ncbi:RHS repeat domain-containing protein [Flavobacterium sp. LB1P62]|uniref:RHS repeat domain-containing protein n=1 Tax=Flavobacterium sp. LB1P62 TaxID=3401715 RepID=UPI003AAED318
MYKYKYNGKELQDELGLNMYDYGARNYDPALGRWMNIDPKAELLEMSSPYVYALNCPVIYLDKDGELPILINGLVASDSERADESYWGKEIINTIKGSGIANPGGDIQFVDGDRGDGGGAHPESYPSNRKEMGKSDAEMDWDTILSKLEKDPKTGKIIEKIQIYTHSRGAAFGAGYTEKLLELIKKNSSKFADADNVIDFVFNMAPHQSNYITAPDGVDSYSLDRTKDPLSGNDMSGVKGAFTTDEGGYKKAHSISTFGKDLKAFTSSFLKGGSSNDVINNFVKTMKDKYNINVTVN